METDLTFKIVGSYSIKQTEWKRGKDRPEEDCYKCHNAKYGTILISKEYPSKWICADCLMFMEEEIRRLKDGT